MIEAGFGKVEPYNSNWDQAGNTCVNIEGDRVVVERREWLS